MAAFLTSVSSVVVIVLMMALGYILRKNGWFDDSFSSNISKLITQIALPASIFISVQDHLTRDGLGNLFQGLLFPALGVVIGYIIAWLTVKIFKIRPGRRGIFMNTVVNANTIFIGMPLNNALFGSKGLSYFLIYYIINTVSTWAFGVYLIYNDDPVAKNKNAAKKINAIGRFHCCNFMVIDWYQSSSICGSNIDICWWFGNTIIFNLYWYCTL